MGRRERFNRAATTGPRPTRCSGRAAASTGRVIGATDRLGEFVVERRVGPPDFLATIYHHLGIDYERVTLPDGTGRPVHIVQNGNGDEPLYAAGTGTQGRHGGCQLVGYLTLNRVAGAESRTT